ncbi:biotin--[acetyl-CoA-carboxylase] ligase [Petrocella sp. FN5]|uniref:biotin--[acetyl-CoA-carboxylase] ligase n=1 Tax=Petrocella sp. FN5 TaxID=3032002 RepID=UPI0023DAD13C|nr:biotin--[acetyl-CoA-carboxylase] ligase [Petrocella sp. FN5]MDF1617354.1 biotin--[acetyl-CoA-carboxylase] ligase [Petrocella sp. FN5]
MRDKILQTLKTTKEYVSGEWLSETLGVSRTAIWKAIHKLKDEGYEIEAVPNRGYRLIMETADLVESAIRLHLNQGSRFATIKVYESVDSTNSEAKRMKVNKKMEEGLIIAKEQTAGKGRRGKYWASVKDEGIWASLVLVPDIPPMRASMLTLIAGLSVAMAIEDKTGLGVGIKWPNDLVISGKKVCGVLTEMSTEADYIHHVVVGVGINVNQTIFDTSLNHIATSLKIELGRNVNRVEILCGFLNHFESLYEKFLKIMDLSFMIDRYNNMCINVDQELRIIEHGKTKEATGIKVTSQGGLMVRNKEGDTEIIYAGDVSIRGINGYV